MSIYGSIYRKAVWPLYAALRGQNTPRLLQSADQRQWLTPHHLAEFQFGELQQLLRHAATQSPWYCERFAKFGLTPEAIGSLSDFKKLPLLTKDEIRQNRKQMLVANYRGCGYSHNTGGSTGAPLQFYVSRNSYEWRMAMSLRGYGWAGCADGDRQFYVWGQPIGTPPLKQRLKNRLHMEILRHRIFSSFQFSNAGMVECIRQLNAFRAVTVIGYTNALCILAQYILDHKIAIAPPHAVITAAEGVNSLQRETIEQAFGAPVFASYGCREFMLIAMECEQHHGLHLNVDNLLVEVLVDGRPAADGEVGEIVITDLHNFGMPFIRYKIGDMGVLTNRQCPCGRGLPLLERVEGRMLDVIRTPDGKILPGEFFPHLMKEFRSVRQFQVIQKELHELQIKLVLAPGDSTADLQCMRTEVQRVAGDVLHVTYEIVPDIPLTTSGKFRVTVSEIANS